MRHQSEWEIQALVITQSVIQQNSKPQHSWLHKALSNRIDWQHKALSRSSLFSLLTSSTEDNTKSFRLAKTRIRRSTVVRSWCVYVCNRQILVASRIRVFVFLFGICSSPPFISIYIGLGTPRGSVEFRGGGGYVRHPPPRNHQPSGLARVQHLRKFVSRIRVFVFLFGICSSLPFISIWIFSPNLSLRPHILWVEKQSMSDNTKRYQADSKIQAVVITQSVITQGRKAKLEW